MPGKVKVKILAGRNLPVMDRSGDTTDAYVELKFGSITYKTDVCRKSLNPQWNSEWYRFEVDDAELQDEPLQIRLMDHDTYSANDAIGKVYINLNPLLLPGMLPPIKNMWTLEAVMNTSSGSQGSVMTGWIPVYDTMHGIRGEVNIIIKVELFSDFNKFRQSSCGVQFFYSPNIPYGYHAQMVHGFVEELVVSDDPEYKWIDKIRTPRASNEARQTLFFKLSGEVQRKIGLKVLDLGGNAVIGYLQNFDLEGESGIVARGIGTAVTLVKLHDVLDHPCDNVNIEEIAFAFSSRTKTQMECLEDDNMPLIPITTSVRIPASYPMCIPTRQGDKTFSFYTATIPSLTHLENAIEASKIEKCASKQRKRVKPIPFLRSNISSTLSSGTSSGLDLTPPESLIDETVKSLRTMLMLDDTGTESSKGQFSKQIKDLRSKFDLIDEKNDLATDTDHDSGPNSIKLFVENVRNPKKETKSTGTIMAALLIGSIQNMPLDDIRNVDFTTTCSLNEQNKNKSNYNPEDNKENNLKNQDPQEASSLNEIEIFSFDDENSTDDTLSDDNTSYNLLSDSRYSLDKTSNFQERISNFSAESCTDSTLQISSDITSNSSNEKLISTEKNKLRKDEIPVITVDTNESINGNTSINASEQADDESRINILTTHNLTETDTRILKSVSSLPGKQDIANTRVMFDTFDKCHRSSSGVEENKRNNNPKYEAIASHHEIHRVHLTRHERDLCRARSQCIQKNRQLMHKVFSAKPKFVIPNNAKDCTDKTNIKTEINDLPYIMTDTSVSNEEVCPSMHIERKKRIHDLINLIDTKLMIPACSMHHVKKTALYGKRKRKREKMRNITISRNLYDKFSSNGTIIKRQLSHKYAGRNPCCIPRVYSTPEYLFLNQHPIISSRTISRSCSSSLVRLTRNCTCVSSNLEKTTVITDCTIDHRVVPIALTKESFRNNPNKFDTPSANSDICKSINTNNLTSPLSDSTIRKCNSVCNLKETLCHIDFTKPTNTANMTYNSRVSRPSPNLRQQDEASMSPSYPHPAVPSMSAKMSYSPATKGLGNVPLHRRSSDSDLSVTPRGNSLGTSDRSMAGPLRTPAAVVRPMNQDTLEMLEYPFITMQYYPPGFILHIGGLVSSRSVKLLERISNLEEPEGRDAWWTEIRMEVRSHARALACNVVIGYKEETSICEDVCVLSASGTAAIINFHNSGQDPDGIVLNKLQQGIPTAVVDPEREKSQQKSAAMRTEKSDSDTSVTIHPERQSGKSHKHFSESNDYEGSCNQSQSRCNLCHLPYCESSVPFRVNVSKCAICKRAKVPDVMFTTIEVPAYIPMTGRGCFIQATVCKSKKDLRGELNAKEISDCLPFLEYELHSLLLNKLKVKGMNAIFGLKLQVSVGERLIIGMAVGTAIFLTALPPPTIPQIASGNSWHNEEQLTEIQKSIVETVKKNREFYHLKSIGVNEMENGRIPSTSDTDESDEDLPELDLGLGTRDACVLEVDDIEDMDRISSLMDDRPPDDFHVVNIQTIPGLEDLEIVRNLQMFTQIYRAKIPAGQFASMPSKYFARLLQSLYFKLRRMVPCALCDMQFKVALPEQDEIQLTVVGMALGLGEPLKTNKYKRKIVCHSLSKDQVRKSDDSDLIFSLDEDQLESNSASDNVVRTCIGNSAVLSNVLTQKPRPRSPLRSKTFTSHKYKHVPLKGRYGVDITPLSYLPGGRIERYQGNLNFFFIRESTSIRENGGLSGFTHSFVMEVLAIVRAHITALGGNAMVAFFMTQCVLLHSPHKNQGQCLINVGGDVVTVSYYADEKHNAVSNC